jgi:hypothetical protein
MPRDDATFDLRAVLEDDFDWSEKRTIVCDVTPAMAEAFLNACNTNNRKLVSGRAEGIAKRMTAGRFVFNGDTVRFDIARAILDGQHRLWAIILSGKTIKMLLIFGLDPEVFDTIDIGAKRTAGDTISVCGEPRYTTEIASACQWLVRWQRGDLDRTNRPLGVTNSDVKEAYRENPDLVTSVELCMVLRSIGAVGIISVVHYRVAQRDADLAALMVATLREPAGVGVTDPFFVFRDTVLNMRRTGGRRDAIMMLALAIKAVNAAAQGKRMKRLSWRRRDREAGSFPQLDVPVKRDGGQ